MRKEPGKGEQPLANMAGVFKTADRARTSAGLPETRNHTDTSLGRTLPVTRPLAGATCVHCQPYSYRRESFPKPTDRSRRSSLKAMRRSRRDDFTRQRRSRAHGLVFPPTGISLRFRASLRAPYHGRFTVISISKFTDCVDTAAARALPPRVVMPTAFSLVTFA